VTALLLQEVRIALRKTQNLLQGSGFNDNVLVSKWLLDCATRSFRREGADFREIEEPLGTRLGIAHLSA